MSPALVGKFLTTGPPGKSSISFFFFFFLNKHLFLTVMKVGQLKIKTLVDSVSVKGPFLFFSFLSFVNCVFKI